MKIAITHPTNWPEVRRGAERFMNELAAYLARRDHEVTIISEHRAPRVVDRDRGYVTRLERSLWHPAMRRIGIDRTHTFYFRMLTRLVGGGYDIVHSCGHTDALAALTVRSKAGSRCVFWMNGSLHDSIRPNGIFSRVMRGADEVIAPSHYVCGDAESRFGRRPVVVPVPVDTERFRPTDESSDYPTLLCASTLDERRKGGTALFRAFDRLKLRRPDVELVVSSSNREETMQRLLNEVSTAHRSSVRFLGPGAIEELPARYASARVTVLPSLREAFGMVLPESLASGTPVVGANHGALPEIICNDKVGTLFEPGVDAYDEPTNVEGLVDALERSLDLSSRPETEANCRARAQELGWDQNGPTFERIYDRVLNSRRLAG